MAKHCFTCQVAFFRITQSLAILSWDVARITAQAQHAASSRSFTPAQ